MALTPERINELKEQAVIAWSAAGFEPMLQVFVAHAIETEVRKQDTELIRQLVDALEAIDDAMPFPVARQVLKVARARLGGKP